MTSIETTIAFIGAGNMAGSLIRGLVAGGFATDRLHVADPIADQLAPLAAQGVHTYSNNREAIRAAEVVVLAVKPQVAADVVSVAELNHQQLLVSIAAGIDCAALTHWTTSGQPIVRCMPNTPALLGAGMSALFANEHCTQQHCAIAEGILAAAGDTLWVSREAELDAVTAVSGSGPAYFFLLMEAMIEAGVDMGLSRTTATRLTLQTAAGAARMATQGDDSPAVLRQNVTSPGGTTQAALEIMAERGLPDIIHEALLAAQHRSVELAQAFGAKQEGDKE